MAGLSAVRPEANCGPVARRFSAMTSIAPFSAADGTRASRRVVLAETTVPLILPKSTTSFSRSVLKPIP